MNTTYSDGVEWVPSNLTQHVGKAGECDLQGEGFEIGFEVESL